jgi:hypothetical protein
MTTYTTDSDYKIKYTSSYDFSHQSQAWEGKRLIVKGGTVQDYLDRGGMEVIGEVDSDEVSTWLEITNRWKNGDLTNEEYELELQDNNI